MNTENVGKVTVEIIPSIRPNLPNMLASAVVSIETSHGTIKIHDCRIIANRSGVAWFALPSFSVPTAGRQYEYRQTLELPPSLAQRVSNLALTEYQAWQAMQKAVRA